MFTFGIIWDRGLAKNVIDFRAFSNWWVPGALRKLQPSRCLQRREDGALVQAHADEDGLGLAVAGGVGGIWIRIRWVLSGNREQVCQATTREHDRQRGESCGCVCPALCVGYSYSRAIKC